MAYTLSSHMARSVPSLTAHHHLEACTSTEPGVLLRVRIAAAIFTIAFAPFTRGRGGSVESTGSLSRGAAVEERIGVMLARAVAWVVHVLGFVVIRVSDDPYELSGLRVAVEVEEDRAAATVGLAVDALIDGGVMGAARPAKQTRELSHLTHQLKCIHACMDEPSELTYRRG